MTSTHPLYNIKRGPHGYAIGKFDSDLNLLAAYNVDTKYCSCPAGPRPSCKHRKMLPRMLAKVDTDEFYCYETQTWSRPLASEASGFTTEMQQALEADGVKLRQLTGEDHGPVFIDEPPVELSTPLPVPAPPVPTPTIRRR